MTRYVIPALLALSLSLGGVAWFWQQRAEDASDALRAASARLAQHEQAAEVHRAHIKRLEEERAGWAAQDRELNLMEGQDAPVSDLLLRAGRVLWP